jgi:hypothetical protein
MKMSNDEQQGTDPIGDDVAASGELIQAVDPWIDLQRPTSEGEYLMRNLASRYEGLMLPLVAVSAQDEDRKFDIITLLVKQLARAQADIFALKAAVLGRDKLILSRDWDYVDPLHSYYSSLGKDLTDTGFQELGRYRLRLDNSISGFGWHGTEDTPTDLIRWSGAELSCGLLVPRFFSGIVKAELPIRTLGPGILSAEGALLLNGRPLSYTLEDEAWPASHKLSFEIDMTGNSQPFFMLEFRINKTYSPAEQFGADDHRQLGIGVNHLFVMTDSAAE